MSKMKFKFLLISLSLTIANWVLINFMIIEIPIYNYLMIESIWALSFYILLKEKKRLKAKEIK